MIIQEISHCPCLESQNHRIVAVGRDLKRSSDPTQRRGREVRYEGKENEKKRKK